MINLRKWSNWNNHKRNQRGSIRKFAKLKQSQSKVHLNHTFEFNLAESHKVVRKRNIHFSEEEEFSILSVDHKQNTIDFIFVVVGVWSLNLTYIMHCFYQLS